MRTLIGHHARVLRFSPAFAGRPIVFVCERNKGVEAEVFFQWFREVIDPDVSLDSSTSRVFPIRQLDSAPTGKKLVHGWWTTAKEKQYYLNSINNHMGVARDLRFERNMFSVCPFQLQETDMTPEKLAKFNREKLITQCRRVQHVEENSSSALSMPRTGISGTVDLQMKRNAGTQDDMFMALGIGLRIMDALIAKELPEFPWNQFRGALLEHR